MKAFQIFAAVILLAAFGLTAIAQTQPAAAPVASMIGMGQFTPIYAATAAESITNILRDPALAAATEAAVGNPNTQGLTPDQAAAIDEAIKAFQEMRAAPVAATQFTPLQVTNFDTAIRALQGALAFSASIPAPGGAAASVGLSPSVAAMFSEAVQRQRKAKPSVPALITSSDLPNVQLMLQSLDENRSVPNGRGGTTISSGTLGFSSGGAGTTNLNLVLSGSGLPFPVIVRQMTIVTALDGLGRPLSTPAGRGPGGSPMAFSNSLGRGSRVSQLNLNAPLGLALRDTSSLKLVEGTVELFPPTDANGGILRIPNIRLHNGRIENPELQKRGAVVFFMGNKESYDAAVNLGGRGGIAGRGTFVPDGIKSFGISYQDPAAGIAGVALQDAQGNPITTRSGTGSAFASNSTSAFMNLTSDTGLPADAQLVIYLAVPDAIKKVSFRFENIELP